MNLSYINTLKNLLRHLRLLTDAPPTHNELLVKACNWALNTADKSQYVLQVYQPVALKPILGTLKEKKTSKYLPAKSLTLAEGTLMPTDMVPTAVSLQAQMARLTAALKANQQDELWLSILEREATTIAANHDYSDIPLYDFIKMSVGIAACLQHGNGKIYLAGGSISGIQGYLYDIVSKNAAKLLKGRSFYLQLLADMLVEETLTQFNLSPCHLVYSSGGGFYVLIPDLEGVNFEKKFNDFAKDMSTKMYNKHHFSLFIEMAFTSFDRKSDIGTVWDELFTNLAKKKYKRLNANPCIKKDFFKPFIEAGGTKTDDRDHITNEEFKSNDFKGKTLDGQKVHKITEQQIDLGKDLRAADFWVSSKNKLGGKITIADPFDFNHYFEEKQGRHLKTFNAPENPDFATVFYGGNKLPIFTLDDLMRSAEIAANYKEGDVKPFEYLVGDGRLSRLAILRMDVDGLGKIFSENIGSNNGNKNICRYVATSRSLDFFFKGYLNTIRNKYYPDTISIIYSGGDDLFMVGKWNDLFTLSETIYKEFQKWSCDNLTISGGAVLVPPKFPIMQSASFAEDAEKKAKNHQFPSGQKLYKPVLPAFEKNSICLFDVPLHWAIEFPIVKNLYLKVLELLVKNELSMNFRTKIMGFTEHQKLQQKLQQYETDLKNKKSLQPLQQAEFQKLKNMNLLRWKWNMAYDLTRFADNKGSVKTEDAQKFVKSVMANAFANTFEDKPLAAKTNYHYLELLQVACRWADLAKRTEEKK